jgi:hypothetical protein
MGMVFDPLPPYASPYRVNPQNAAMNLNVTHEGQTGLYTKRPGLNPVYLGVDSQPLNATDIPIDKDGLAGLRDDEPVPIEGRWQLPKTNYPAVDIPLSKLSNAVQYLPYATEDSISSSMQWGAIGAVAGFSLTAVGLLLLKSTHLLADCSRGLKLALPFMWGSCLGMVSGILGFSASFSRNFYNYRLHMRKNKLAQKHQNGTKSI